MFIIYFVNAWLIKYGNVLAHLHLEISIEIFSLTAYFPHQVKFLKIK